MHILPVLDILHGYIFHHPRLTLVACFPACRSGYMIFSELSTGCMPNLVWYWLHAVSRSWQLKPFLIKIGFALHMVWKTKRTTTSLFNWFVLVSRIIVLHLVDLDTNQTFTRRFLLFSPKGLVTPRRLPRGELACETHHVAGQCITKAATFNLFLDFKQ